MTSMLVIFVLANFDISSVICQIDFGSFTLGSNKRGDLEVSFNQAANVLGFGGDRGLDLTIGEGRVQSKARQGALIGGERVGVDSGFGINESQGLSFGNVLNFGNGADSSKNSVGQFLSFLERIGKFVATLGKSSNVSSTSPPQEKTSVGTDRFFDILGEPREQSTSEKSMKLTKSDDVDYNDYYNGAAVEDEAHRQSNATVDPLSEEYLATLNHSIAGNESTSLALKFSS